MLRTCALILAMIMGFVLYGCDSFDSNPKERVKMSKSEMYAELEKLKAGKGKLQKQIDIDKEVSQNLKVENEKKIAYLSERNRSLSQVIHKLKRKVHNLTDDNYALIEKLDKIQADYKISPDKLENVQAEDETPPEKPENVQAEDKTSPLEANTAVKTIEQLKVKVLYGDGNPNSAVELAKRIRNMGYNLQFVDKAPQSNFRITTIFFAPDFKPEANRLMSSLGGKIMLKSLSWPSKFDLIAVTGSTK